MSGSKEKKRGVRSRQWRRGDIEGEVEGGYVKGWGGVMEGNVK